MGGNCAEVSEVFAQAEEGRTVMMRLGGVMGPGSGWFGNGGRGGSGTRQEVAGQLRRFRWHFFSSCLHLWAMPGVHTHTTCTHSPGQRAPDLVRSNEVDRWLAGSAPWVREYLYC